MYLRFVSQWSVFTFLFLYTSWKCHLSYDTSQSLKLSVTSSRVFMNSRQRLNRLWLVVNIILFFLYFQRSMRRLMTWAKETMKRVKRRAMPVDVWPAESSASLSKQSAWSRSSGNVAALKNETKLATGCESLFISPFWLFELSGA